MFTATWRGPCKSVAPVFANSTAYKYPDKIIYLQLDIDDLPELRSTQLGLDAKALPLIKKLRSQVVVITSTDQPKQVLQNAYSSKKGVIIMFTTDWHGPCRFIGPTIFTKLSDDHVDKIVVLQVDTDDIRVYSREYQINVVLTFISLKDGVQFDRQANANSKRMRTMVEELASQIASF
ncbi:hypothetical protein LUZ60_005298 [Juncus effusus]|nr:hypothetical protein LUZ60_005298 [Juncus effusus]